MAVAQRGSSECLAPTNLLAITATIRPDLQAPLADIQFLVGRALAEDLKPHRRPHLSALVAQADAWGQARGKRRPLLEASGGITLATLDRYADACVDLISSGSITNSAPVLDIGLDVVAD